MNNEKKIPLICPACEQSLAVSEMCCDHCDTVIRGHFKLPLLARLSSREQQMILDFVKSSGSLKDISSSMGLSYPTVRNMLDALIDHIKALEAEAQSSEE